MPARRDDDEACSQNQNAASRARTTRDRRGVESADAPWQNGFLELGYLYSTNESH